MSARDRILDAAADIMRERGVARATTKEIAKAAGYSEAFLYKQFQDKEDLIVHVLRERMPTGSVPSPRPGEATVAANLVDIARALTAFYQQALPLFGGLLAEHTRLVAHRKAMKRHGAGPGHAVAGISTYLPAEQELGRVDTAADVEMTAALLDGTCFHQAFLHYYAEGPDAGPIPEDIVYRMAHTLARAL
ncbi:TetR/AcrR family transcriptional regulator [Nocardia sp. AB354]|uniref:TetR/AcrR family transcriptional regulator n=1 Tax=Nocardia sp. AB354 TaxID=3413283 RepID=UPI003C137ED0